MILMITIYVADDILDDSLTRIDDYDATPIVYSDKMPTV